MSVKVLFFASLAESLGYSELQIDPEPDMTVRDAWAKASANKAVPNNLLAAVNMEYADLSVEVKDGDEVAFFPPVTGG